MLRRILRTGGNFIKNVLKENKQTKKREKINRKIGLTFDFLRQVVDNPGLINKIPDGSILEFV